MAALPRVATLLAIAGGGGIAVGTMALLFYRKTESVATNSNFLLRAVDIIQEQPISRDLLGESIKIGKASFDSGWLRQNDLKLTVPVKGDNDNALLIAYARRKDSESKFRLYKLEATFGKIAGKKLVLLDRTNEPDTDESEETTDKTSDGPKRDNKPAKEKEAQQERKLTPEEAKVLYREQMKSWQPVK